MSVIASKWSIGEASTTGIDSYLVRTDRNGAFHIPPRRYDQVCSRVALMATAYVPGYESVWVAPILQRIPIRLTPLLCEWIRITTYYLEKGTHQ